MSVKTLKDYWIKEQYGKIKLVLGNDFSDDEIYKTLEEEWNKRKEPKYVYAMTKDSISTTTVESMMDRFLNSNYIFSGYGVLYKQPTEHVSIFNKVIWDVIGERKNIRSFIAKQRKEKGEEFMLNEFTRYDSKQKSRKIVVNAAYGVIAAFMSVFFNNGLLMGTSQNSITKTGQVLTTVAISNIENWLENNIDFVNISDLLTYILKCKTHYEENKETNEYYLQLLDDISQDKLFNYLLSLIEKPNRVDLNYLKIIVNRMTNIERKSLFYKNNMPAITEQDFWKQKIKLILDAGLNNDKETYNKELEELNKIVFNTTAVDFIHPERFRRMLSKHNDAVIISDTDSVFISITQHLNNIKEYYNTDKISKTDFDLMISKIFIHLTDHYTEYILNSYMDFMNVSDERKTDISMKSEYDYSKILVNGKKNYAGWKVGELSVPLGDNAELDIKGLSIKKTTVVKDLRDAFSNILENLVLKSDKIDTLKILEEFDNIEAEIRRNLKQGTTTFLQPASVSGEGSYAKPESVPAWRGSQIWNYIHPDQAIDLPGRVMQIRIKPMDDYEFLKYEYPDVYEKIQGILNGRVDLLGTKYDGNSKEKSTMKNVLDIVCIPYQLEKIPDWIIPLIDVQLIVDRLLKPGQFILNAIGVSTPDDYTTNVVNRRIIEQIII